MPNYKLQKKGRSARRVEVRVEHIEIQVLALILCAVLAFVIWLYVVGISKIPHDATTDTTTPAADPASAAVLPVPPTGWESADEAV